VAALKTKLRGFWNYHGVIGTSERNGRFAWFAPRLDYKWLNRLSQRRSYNMTSFIEACERWEVPMPRVVEKPWPQARQTLHGTISNQQLTELHS
jgi:RNA-directed DNA polymerase